VHCVSRFSFWTLASEDSFVRSKSGTLMWIRAFCDLMQLEWFAVGRKMSFHFNTEYPRNHVVLGVLSVEKIEDVLLQRLNQKFGTNPTLSDGLAFVGADSVGMAELTVELEQEFGVTITDEVFTVETVQELANYIRSLQESNNQA
ncbi:MAG: acyl carrier protein, partial [Planctomycetota bacterium]